MSPDTDSELAAVREFRAALDEPRDGALARGRWQLAHTDRPERPHRRRTWLLATSGAALAVAVVVGGTAAVHNTAAPRREQAVTPGQSVPQSGAPVVADLPVAHGTKAPMRPPVAGKAGANHAAAVEALTRLAAKQSGDPVTVGPDQVLYVKTYNLRDGDGRYIHELWVERQGGVALRIRRTDDMLTGIDHSLTKEEVAEQVAWATVQTPSLDSLNLRYVETFPAGAGQAHALSGLWFQWAAQEYPGRQESMIWKHLFEVFHIVEPQLSTEQRAAFYLALLDLPSLKGTTATIGGRQYDVICQAAAGRGPAAGDCRLFDTATGRYAGDAGTGADMVVTADGLNFVDVGVQPRPAPGTAEAVTEKKDASGSSTKPKRT